MIALLVLLKIVASEKTVLVNVNKSGLEYDRFWASTGFCPPDPKNSIAQFLLSKDQLLNLAYIGAVPNNGIKQVRVHWLLNLIRSNEKLQYNFTNLDDVLDVLYKNRLNPGFELMGIPLGDSVSSTSYDYWYNLVRAIATRYSVRYGSNYISKWRFETWNEPDLASYNILNFTLNDYLGYVRGCIDGLRDSRPDKDPKRHLKLGGPAGLFNDPARHPLCWGLLESWNETEYPTRFISFHKKGDGIAGEVANKGIELLDIIHSQYASLRQIPIANDEADILTNWSKSEEWRGDVRYAAMVAEVVVDHLEKIVIDRGIKIEVLSNDNGFLNYHPYYFTQRTLRTRFQMNNTRPPHVQFIKKPVYSVMGLLSLLGNKYISTHRFDDLLTILSTKSENNNKFQTLSLLITYVNNTEEDNKKIMRLNVVCNNLPDSNDTSYAIYSLNNNLTNPFNAWKESSPAFPDKNLRAKLRGLEGPHRFQGPTAILKSTLSIQINLTLPSVTLVHVCSKINEKPGRVTRLKAYNITQDEVLLTWKDTKVGTKCIRTYEVEFQPGCECDITGKDKFRRLNLNDTIFLSYQHVATGGRTWEGTRGKYRVRALDYWNRTGSYSKIINYSCTFDKCIF